MSINVGYGVMGLDSSPAYEEISKVIIFLDETNYIEAGDDTGAALECFSPFANQAIADDLLSRIAHFKYQPFDAAGTFVDPAAEVGDDIKVGDVSSAIFNIDYTFNTLFTADIDAPTTREIDHEYPYEPQTDRQFKRTMADVGSRISQTASAISAEVTARGEADALLATSITETADRIELKFDNEFNDLHAYIRFENGNIILGRTSGDDSKFKVIITNQEMGFYEYDTKVAYVANNQFVMPYGIIQNKLDLGGYQLDATDGIKFRWKGRDG